MYSEYYRLTLTEVVAGYRSRALSPVEVVQAALARAEELNPAINAIYHLEPEAAIEQARQSELRWMNGEPLGPLDGVPTTTKDILPTLGMPGQYLGAAGQPGCIGKTDHPTVARMREAGAVIIGRNTMCDYGIIASGISTRYGVTRNPWNLNKTPGASSSGAAASVTAGIEPVSVGTDIVGSIRLPASYCGLVGLKPTRGRVPYYFPNSPAVAAGPLARNVDDLATFMNVLSRPDSRDFTALPYDARDYTSGLDSAQAKGRKILVITDLGMGEAPGEQVAAAVRRAASVFEELGANVEVCETPPFARGDYKPAENMYRVRYLSTMLQLSELLASKSTTVWNWAQKAACFTALDFYRLTQEVDQLREKAIKLIQGYDFVLLPTTPNSAFAAELASPDPTEMFAPWSNTFLFNLTEQPAISVPCGLDQHGMPIGLQIVGNRYDDVGVLEMAKVYERQGPWVSPIAPRIATRSDLSRGG